MPSSLLWKRLQLGLALFILLCGIYLPFYKGAPISDDELMLLSSTDSFVKEGDFALYSMFNRQDELQRSIHEPLQTILAAPLFWLAQHIDGLGIVHVVWLFNLLVVAATCMLFYWGGVSLGYSDSVSWLAALVMGTATIVLPYTQNFFREPLAGFWILAAVLLAFHLNQQWNRWLGSGLVLVCIAAFLTKTTALAALIPVLASILFPRQANYRRTVVLCLMAILGVFGILVMARLFMPESSRFNPAYYNERLQAVTFDYFLTVVKAYLFSPGRSIWAGSPVLLLGLYGSWLAYRQGKLHFAFAPLLLLLAITVIYGFGARDWHGGRGWGTRYLVPIVPAMSLSLLPVAEKLLQRGANRLWQLMTAGLLAFSVLVQLGGALMPLDLFYARMNHIFQENALPAFYNEGTWQVQYTPWFIHLKHFDLSASDAAWNTVAEPGWHMGLIAALMVLAGLVLIWESRNTSSLRRFAIKAGVIGLFLPVGFGIALHSLYYDPRLQGNNPKLFELVAALETREGDHDMIYLANPAYQLFFMNYYKGKNLWVTLPKAQGERFSENEIPVEWSGNVEEQLSDNSKAMLQYGARHYEWVWVVENQSQYQWWSYRPAERWFTKYNYPFALVEIDPFVRLIGFDTHPAPVWIVQYGEVRGELSYLMVGELPEREPFYFGDSLILDSYRLPEETLRAGEVLPISLSWQVAEDIAVDYHIGIFLLKPDGFPVVSRNSPPQNAFGNMQNWFPDPELVVEPSQIDNHGILLPPDLPPGTYTVGVIVYDWRDATRLPVSHQEQPVRDNMALLGTIHIE